MKLPGRRNRGTPQRRFMDALKEDVQMVGGTERDAREGEMEADELMGEADSVSKSLLSRISSTNSTIMSS